MKNYYEVLEVVDFSDYLSVRSAYKRLLQIYHPDKNQGDTHALEKTQNIREAFEFLRDKEKKRKLDDFLVSISRENGKKGADRKSNREESQSRRQDDEIKPRYRNSVSDQPGKKSLSSLGLINWFVTVLLQFWMPIRVLSLFGAVIVVLSIFDLIYPFARVKSEAIVLHCIIISLVVFGYFNNHEYEIRGSSLGLVQKTVLGVLWAGGVVGFIAATLLFFFFVSMYQYVFLAVVFLSGAIFFGLDFAKEKDKFSAVRRLASELCYVVLEWTVLIGFVVVLLFLIVTIGRILSQT